MAGYRPGYSEQHSPYYAAGLADGHADAARKPADRTGPDPERSWSFMYQRGYRDGISGANELAEATTAHGSAS